MKVGIDSSNTEKFTKDSGKTIVDICATSIIKLLKKTKIDKSVIDGVIISSCSNEQYLGNIITELAGISTKISTKVDNLCNSGTTAIYLAYSLIRSGICNAIIVSGVEKRNSPGNKLNWDITRGIYDMPIHWAALYAKAHFRNFGTNEQDLAYIGEKNHKNANKNSKALFYNKKITFDDIMNSDNLVDPLRKLDCCYPCEGASSLLMLSEKLSKQTEIPIWITGISQNNQGASFNNVSSDLRSIKSTKIASNDAFKQSHLLPKDIDISELHDAFSIMEILAYEDIGFVEKGNGAKFSQQNSMYTNVRGGLIGCGHPIGVTGIAQVGEIVTQLQGKASGRQIKHCKRGLVQNMAAAGTSTTIIILES